MIPTVNYHDHFMRLVLAIIGAHVMVLYNDPQSFYEAVFTTSYLRGFIASFIISYIIVLYIEKVTVRLDRRYEWHTKTLQRLISQAIFGICIPSFVLFLLVTFFMWIFNVNILNTTYLRQDYPLAILMLLVLNLYHFGLYCFMKLKKVEVVSQTTMFNSPLMVEEQDLILSNSLDGNATEVKIHPVYKDTILIDTFDKTIPVPSNDIAYVYLLNKTVFIRLKEMDSLNSSYQVSYTLKELETMLNPEMFFRINRQMIINRTCCTGYRSEKNKTLSISLTPSIYGSEIVVPKEHEKLQIVSEDRCSNFKMWMDR